MEWRRGGQEKCRECACALHLRGRDIFSSLSPLPLHPFGGPFLQAAEYLEPSCLYSRIPTHYPEIWLGID